MRIGRLELGPGAIILLFLVFAGLVVVGLKQAVGIDLIGMFRGKGSSTSSSPSPEPSSGASKSGKINIKGSSAIGNELAKDWAQDFMSSHSGTVVLIETKGTSTGFQALIKGEAEIAAASRPANDKEKEEATKAGFSLDSSESEHIIGFDAIAIVVNSDNPVNQLTVAQLKNIFTGKVTEWSQVGGKSGAIKVVLRPKELGAYELVKDIVLGKDTPFLAGAEEIKENGKLSEKIREDKNAIGFVALGGVGATKPLKIAATATTIATGPSEVTIRNKSYLLNRNLYLYTHGAPQGIVKEFIDYALGAGQDAVANRSFVNLKLKLVSNTDASAGSGATDKRQKYNTDIRFRTSSTDVNNLALYDLNQIANDLCGKTNNIEVELIGYTDSQGNPQQNTALSQQRAESVAKVLQGKCDKLKVNSIGKGGESPIGDNTTEEGRLLNRRVEIWVLQK